jgi:hypothetical protein
MHHSFKCWKQYKADAPCLKKPCQKIWLGKLDEWFTYWNIHQISSLIVEEKILPGPTILATNAREMEVTFENTNNTTINSVA